MNSDDENWCLVNGSTWTINPATINPPPDCEVIYVEADSPQPVGEAVADNFISVNGIKRLVVFGTGMREVNVNLVVQDQFQARALAQALIRAADEVSRVQSHRVD